MLLFKHFNNIYFFYNSNHDNNFNYARVYVRVRFLFK